MKIITSPVFRGLLRQPLWFGVEYSYVIFSGLISILFFLNINLLGGLIFFPLHALGWVLCRQDPHIFSLLRARALLGRLSNVSLWGVHAYEPC